MDISSLSKYTKTISQYFGASLIPMLLSLASNPFIAQNMSPEDYAITGYYSSFNSLMSPLIVFYMLHYYNKRFFEVDDVDKETLRATLVKALIYFSGIMSILCFCGLYIYIYFFNNASTIPFSPYAALSLFSLPVTGIYSLMLADMRMCRKSKNFLRVSVMSGVLLTILNLVFVVFLKLGALGKLIAPLLCNIVFFCVSLWYFRKIIKIQFNFRIFREMLIFCFPLAIASMLGFFTNGYDRVLLERIGNNAELGYYSVGVSMAAYISVFQSAIGNTFQPDFYQSVVQRDKKRLFKVCLLILGSVALFVSLFVITSPIIVKILTAGKYMESVKYTRVIALSSFTCAVYSLSDDMVVALGKTRISLATKIITTVLSVALFNFLITRFEYIGAAWGLVFSFIISFIVNILLLYLSRKKILMCHRMG